MVIRFHFFYFFLIRNFLKKLFSVRFRRRTSPVTTWLYDRRKMNEKKWEIIAAIRLNLQVPLDNFKKDKTKVSLTSPRVALSRLQRKAKREETKKTSSLRLSIFNVSSPDCFAINVKDVACEKNGKREWQGPKRCTVERYLERHALKGEKEFPEIITARPTDAEKIQKQKFTSKEVKKFNYTLKMI